MAEKQPIAQVECEFGKVRVGNASGCVTMGCRPDCVAMRPDQARALALYLNAVADGIEGKPVAEKSAARAGDLADWQCDAAFGRSVVDATPTAEDAPESEAPDGR